MAVNTAVAVMPAEYHDMRFVFFSGYTSFDIQVGAIKCMRAVIGISHAHNDFILLGHLSTLFSLASQHIGHTFLSPI